jgi:nuclear pore complex protein Nup93
LQEALQNQQVIEHREASFISHFRTWIESPERKLPKTHRDHLQTVYNAHMLHSSTADPFKLALYKLMGRLEPSKRNFPRDDGGLAVVPVVCGELDSTQLFQP